MSASTADPNRTSSASKCPESIAATFTGMRPQILQKYEPQASSRLRAIPSLYSSLTSTNQAHQYLLEKRGVNLAYVALTVATSYRLETIHGDATRDELRTRIDERHDNTAVGSASVY